MIVLKELSWGNMFSYGDNNSIDFNSGDKVVQIDGVNGSGKSSINLVLEELLYNKNSRKIAKADILNRDNGSTKYWAELELEVSGVTYTVELERAKSAKLVLKKGSEDISGHTAAQTYKTIASILGDDFSTFTQKVYQGMASSLQFLTATDSARKKFLTSLLGLEVYGEYGESIKEYARDLSAELKSLEESLETNLKWVKRNTAKRNEPYVDEPALPGQEDHTDTIDEISTLKARALNIDKHNKSVVLREKLEKEEAQGIEELLGLVEPGAKPKVPDTVRLAEVTDLVKDLRAEHTAAQLIVKKIKDLEGQCPTCLSDIDESRIDALVVGNQAVMFDSRSKAEAFKKEVSKITAEVSVEKAHKKEAADYTDLKSKIEDNLELLQERILGLETEKLDKDTLAAEIKEATQSLSASQAKSEAALTEYRSVLEFNAKVKAAKEGYELYAKTIQEQKTALEIVVDELEKVNILKEAFSPNGIVALRVNQAVQDLQVYINEYLNDFCKGRFTLHFVLEGAKLNVKVQDKGKLVGIQALSSGQLARVTLSAVLAIRKIVAKNSVAGINLLFLDEVTATLDTEGKEQLVEILLREKDFNAFIIMHGWKHPLVPVLEVKESLEGSYIEEVK